MCPDIFIGMAEPGCRHFNPQIGRAYCQTVLLVHPGRPGTGSFGTASNALKTRNKVGLSHQAAA
ncbi:hypothetical protein Clim_1210 [Chlorobium limicola DSM 245]|jgi:hypothetical protein|uniref:Uncharacterized protein n=2 Tax=Chlorobium limicola TaxID=1092 RepID=B3ECK2_CHLL2|nr:hypothetical protein Clim_1210 [Chlorobium limicola DSM 245]